MSGISAQISLTGVLLLTTITGSIALIVWYFAGRILVYAGYSKWYYASLKLVVGLFLLPVSYTGLILLERYQQRWNGRLFMETPAILDASEIFVTIWAAGAALMAIRFSFQVWRLRRRNKKNIPCDIWQREIFAEVCSELRIPVDRVKLSQNYMAYTAEFTGVVRCQVILPVKKWNRDELRMVFMHELTHYKHRDVLLKYLVILVSILQFFNPMVWWLCRLVRRWSEHACDQCVCEKVESRTVYFSTILQLADGVECNKTRSTVHLIEDKNELLERVEFMDRLNKVKKRAVGAAVLMSGMLVLLTSTTVLAASDGAARQYRKLVEMSDVVEKVNENAVDSSLVEHEDNGPDSSILVEEGETAGGIGARAIQGFAWTVAGSSIKRTNTFYVEEGQSISVNVYMNNHTNLNIKIGIVKPSAARTYVEGNDHISHDFKAATSGYYRVFVQNDNSVSVDVEGTYNVR